MGKLRDILGNIQGQFGRMKVAHRLLVVFVAITLGLVLWIVYQQTRAPALVQLFPGAAPSDQRQFQTLLSGNGFSTSMEGGNLMVAPGDVNQARALVAEAGILPDDKSILFRNILLNQSWTNTREQNEKLYNEALQNELELTVQGFKGVRSADVYLDVPEPKGIGQAVRKPTAAVSVSMKTGEPVPQATVDAIASLIAGSRAGLTMESVRVIDGATGQQRRARTDDYAMSSSYLEHAALVERQTQQKVSDLLAYIPGVVVAVTAQVDVTRVTSQTNTNLPMGQGTLSLPKKEETTEDVSSEGGGGKADVPGVQSNQSADITQVSTTTGQGGKTQKNTSKVESENHVGIKTETVVDPRGFPTMVAVSVNVPRNFVAKVVKAAAASAGGTPAGDASKPPTEQEIADAFDKKVKPVIEASIKPQVRALMMQGMKNAKPDEVEAMVDQSVGVSLIPMDFEPPAPQTAGLLGTLTSTAGGGGGGSILDKALLGVISLVALGMMFALVKKSGKKVEVPTAEELVGLPPAIDGGSDIVGEAEESESAMTGIEIGDDTMESQKMLEQVNTMVGQSPDNVARLLNRWIEREE
ncbi:MAG: flagellar M-ring protein FliF C-terminal domain-containing protein [Phycisphaerales bacterium]